jgi:hypothetical protein
MDGRSHYWDRCAHRKPPVRPDRERVLPSEQLEQLGADELASPSV